MSPWKLGPTLRSSGRTVQYLFFVVVVVLFLFVCLFVLKSGFFCVTPLADLELAL